MGTVSALLTMGLFLLVLSRAGWTFGAPTGPGTVLHQAYLQATTASFAGIVACQIGTAFASRTQHASLRRIGLTSNRLLLAGIGFELVFAAAVIYLPPLQALFGTAALPAWVLATLLPMPVLVWGVDEVYRAGRRRRRMRTAPSAVVAGDATLPGARTGRPGLFALVRVLVTTQWVSDHSAPPPAAAAAPARCVRGRTTALPVRGANVSGLGGTC